MPLIDTSNLTDARRIEFLEKSVLILETQIERIIADIESEKGTRSRATQSLFEAMETLDKRLRLVEKSIWVGFGLLLAAQLLLRLKP